MYDDQSDPGQAAKIYEKLIVEDKVDLLLGPWGTPHHVAVAGVLERHKFPMVGDTAASVLLRGMKPGYIWFPTSALPDEMGKQLPLLLKSQGVKTLQSPPCNTPSHWRTRSSSSRGLRQTEFRWSPMSNIHSTIRDMTALITTAKAANPDAELSLCLTGDLSPVHAAIEGVGF